MRTDYSGFKYLAKWILESKDTKHWDRLKREFGDCIQPVSTRDQARIWEFISDIPSNTVEHPPDFRKRHHAH